MLVVTAEAAEPELSIQDYIAIDNDGLPREVVYGDCGINPSFNADYYDCYIPYNTSLNEIGGYADGAIEAIIAQYNSGMLDSTTYGMVTGWTNRENDFSLTSQVQGRAVRGYEESTGMVTYTLSDGTVFYVCAFTNFCYRSEEVINGDFPIWDLSNRGQLVDVILTDGTVIHFVVGDVADTRHTNGGDTSTSTFEVRYDFTDLNYEQYRHLYHAQSGHSIELWGVEGCSLAFDIKYGIGNGADDNRIAYIRMYDAYLRQNVSRTPQTPAGVSYRTYVGENCNYSLESLD